MIARIAMLAAAAAVIAVCAVWLRDAHLFAEGSSTASSARTPADFARAARFFSRADALSAGTRAQAAEAFALVGAHRPARAAALAEDSVRREPRYIRAWIVLALADQQRDPGRAAQARARIRGLSPPVGRARQ